MNHHFFEHYARMRHAELTQEICRERAVRQARAAHRSMDAYDHGPAGSTRRAVRCAPAQVRS